MKNFIFESVLQADEQSLMKGNFIIVLQTVRVPPHLLIAVNGRSWSISVSGQLPGEPLEKLFAYITRKEVPTIFSELKLPTHISQEVLCDMLDKAVAKYPEVHENEISCLHPIRDVAAEVFGEVAMDARFIYELIPAIQLANGIGRHYGFYLERYLDEKGNLAMPLYSAEDVARATAEAVKQFAENKE